MNYYLQQLSEMLRHNHFYLSPAACSNYLKSRILSKNAQMDLALFSFPVSHIYLSIRCNLRCSFCSVGNILTKEKQTDMSLDEFKALFKLPELNKCLCFNLSGGEPLLNEDLIPIIKFIKKQRRIAYIVTNGLLLNGPLYQDIVSAGADVLKISVYEENIDKLLPILPRVNEIRPVYLSRIVMNSDLREKDYGLISQTAELATRTGCLGVKFQMLRSQRAVSDFSAERVDDDVRRFYECKEFITKRYPKLSCFWDPPLSSEKNNKFAGSCKHPWREITIAPGGMVKYCCGVNISQDSNIFAGNTANTDYWVGIREHLMDPQKVHPDCEFCPFLKCR